MASSMDGATFLSLIINPFDYGWNQRAILAPNISVRMRPYWNRLPGSPVGHVIKSMTIDIVDAGTNETILTKDVPYSDFNMVYNSFVGVDEYGDLYERHYIFNDSVELSVAEKSLLYQHYTENKDANFKCVATLHMEDVYIGQHFLNIDKSITKSWTIPQERILFDRSLLTITVNNSASGGNSAFGYYIKGKSKAHLKFDSSYIDMSRRYGAYVKKYKVTVNGVTYTITPATTIAEFDTEFLNIVGADEFTVTITDSRGYEVTAKYITGYTIDYSITVYDYAEPTLSSLSAYRSDSEGIQAGDGTYIALKATEVHSSVDGHNTASLVARYKPTSGSFGDDIALQSNTRLITGAGLISTTSAYLVEIEVTDTAGFTATFQQFISSALAVFSVKDGGKSVGVGMYVDTELDNTFHVSFDTYMHGDMYLGETKLTEAQLIALLNLIQEV